MNTTWYDAKVAAREASVHSGYAAIVGRRGAFEVVTDFDLYDPPELLAEFLDGEEI